MPPPPPPPGPPPPPSFGAKGPAKMGKSGGGEDRNQLLNSIRQGAALKKTVTNDRSAPIIEGKSNNNKPNGPKPFSVPNSSASNGTGAPQLGGLFAGGMPVLKATGRGRLGPANQPSSGPGGLSRTPSTETVPTASTSWKPKTLNGSTSGSSISSPSSVNRGPPPQPPPASRKPSLVTSDATDNSSVSRNPPTIPTKPPTLNFGKPNLAPKPPPAESKPTSPVPPATGRGGVTPSKRPSPPPKSPSIASMSLNWPVNPTSPPPPPPPSSKPTVVRAQSLRSAKPGVPGNSDSEESIIDSQERRNQSSQDISSPPVAPPPPPNRYATLPRNAIPPAGISGAPRGPLPPVPRVPMANGVHSSPAKIRPPSVRPPPPPQRINPPASIPPPPPSSAPPPPPPHRMSPAPPPPSAMSNSRSPSIYNNNSGPPTPPTRGSSMQRSSGSMTSLSSMVVPPPPPPPPSLANAFQQSAEAKDFESRFAGRFRPLNHLPPPEPFIGFAKNYPTRQLINQSMKRQQAPQPPTMEQNSGSRWPSSNAAPC